MYRPTVANRVKSGVRDTLYAAYLLYHRYCGKELDPIDVIAAVNYITASDEELGAEVSMYLARVPPYCGPLTCLGRCRRLDSGYLLYSRYCGKELDPIHVIAAATHITSSDIALGTALRMY